MVDSIRAQLEFDGALVIAVTGDSGTATARADGGDLVIEFSQAGTATFTLG